MSSTVPGSLRTTSRATVRTLSALAAVAAALLGVLALAGPAAAHAALTGSDPAEGAVVDDAPRQVTLDFSEGVAMSDGAIRVLDPRGARVDTGTVRDTGTGGTVRRTVALDQGLGQGTYTVAWQAVSADSHPVSGAFTFSIGKPSETSAKVPQQDENAGGGTVGACYGIGRYAAYAGFVLLIGGAAFVLLCSPRAASSRAVQRLVTTGWSLLAASTLALLLLRGPYTGSGRFADVLDLGGLKDVVATKPGAALVSRLLLLAAGALFTSVLFGVYARQRAADEPEEAPRDGRTPPRQAADEPEETPQEGEGARQRRDLHYGLSAGGALVAVGLAATWALAEHASTGIQTGPAVPVDVLHLLAVALWLGGLTALFCLLRWGPSPTGTTVRRFSRLAFGCVVVLAGTGLYQSWRQVGSWSALTDTSYGQLLVVKILLVGAVLSVAWFSRRWTTRLTELPEQTGTAPRNAASGSQGAPAGAAAAVPHGRAPERATVRTAAPGADDTPQARRAHSPEGSHPAQAQESTSDDPVRAAQLARQRAAADAARQRREREADPGRSALRRSVLAETALAVVLLAVTTVLTGTEPGRTEEQVRAAEAARDPGGPVDVEVPFDTGGPGGKGRAALEISPGTRGGNTLELRTTAPSGKPVEAAEVKVAFTLPARDLGPLSVPLEPVGREKGHWRASGLQLPMAGKWKVAVTVRTSDIDQVTKTTTATIG
ncbi:copper resistance protein CopC [Streptomyces qinglanensis]|uniref:Protein YobA n=1 Tax=Streptomyces qinglanensis TaxID=943816 RepID=A0A1H9Q3D2_9ACTN|nr:copper resistance protein CopC [Streptomyces qinglanensis]SER54930.1 copper transport protein [Streptomyces qinglanensis]